MKKAMLLAACAAACAFLPGGLGAAGGDKKLTEDPPLMHKPQSGDITGTISPAGDVTEVSAAYRYSLKTVKAESYDKGTGRFVIRNLPGDATYDICLKLKDGRQIEGITLEYFDQRMLRLAELRRKQLGLPAEEGHEYIRDDAAEILKFATDLKSNDFMDKSRVLYLSGDGKRATVLVELMRTREFYAQANTPEGAQIVWRVELWYFEWQHGGWERTPDQERVLRRERIPSGQWQKIDLHYLPELSVHVDDLGKSKPVEFKIPAKLDPAAGRPANSAPDLKTEPILLGLPASQPASEPASRPVAGSGQ